MFARRPTLRGSAMLVLAAAVAGCASSSSTTTITRREYDRIRIGMSYAQVRRIVGGPGEVTSSTSNAAGFSGATYSWPGTASGSRARIVIANGSVFSKSQSQLR